MIVQFDFQEIGRQMNKKRVSLSSLNISDPDKMFFHRSCFQSFVESLLGSHESAAQRERQRKIRPIVNSLISHHRAGESRSNYLFVRMKPPKFIFAVNVVLKITVASSSQIKWFHL